MTLEVNTNFLHYRVLSRLGAGGMGEVFLAEDSRLRRKVALKVLPPEFTNDKQRLHRFEQEAQTASALNHPNIVTIFEVGAENGLNFIVTEFIEGLTLRQKMREGLLDLNAALEIAQQMTSALVAAHQAGIIHRDIKPENIMIRPDGLVKVLDFGLAKLTAPAADSVDNEAETIAQGLTKPGMILGTLHYMSPEQVRAQPLDHRSDIFSVGAVIYEMLTGQGPFDRATKSDVIAAI
jgi:serine/threonine protein kinase